MILILIYLAENVFAKCDLFTIDCANWEMKITADEPCRQTDYASLNLNYLVNSGDSSDACKLTESYYQTKIN